MPPPEKIYEVLKFANQETNASQLYHPYRVLLNCLFPPEEGYMICPKYKPPTQPRLVQVDFNGIYTVKKNYTVVFLLEVKSSEDLSHISTRQEADSQMREKFRNFFGAVKVEMLYGACAIGTKICIYKLHMRSRLLFPFEPNVRSRLRFPFEPTVLSDPESATEMAPVEWWNMDLLTLEGQDQLSEIVEHIKEMCTKIG